MHQPIVRRLTDGRAHHQKRMPRALLVSDDLSNRNFTLTGPITLTQVVPVSTTATSSVLSSQSPSLSASPSSVSSSASQLSNSSVVTSTMAASRATSPTPAATASNGTHVSSNLATKSLPSGAIPGIVVVVILAIIGLAVFLTRKRFIRNRRRRRSAWGAPIMHMPDTARGDGVPPSDEPIASRPKKQPPPIALPPMSYNNPALVAITSVGAITTTPAQWSSSPLLRNGAIVKSTFIPTLPDELSLKMGETLRVLNEYDDGWALCANRMGEQGMVPLDCLDRSEEVQDHRHSGRIASLGASRF